MMHDELWAAVQLKLDNAEFHLAQMRRSIQGPERTGHTMEAAVADAERTEQRHAHATPTPDFIWRSNEPPAGIQC